MLTPRLTSVLSQCTSGCGKAGGSDQHPRTADGCLSEADLPRRYPVLPDPAQPETAGTRQARRLQMAMVFIRTYVSHGVCLAGDV